MVYLAWRGLAIGLLASQTALCMIPSKQQVSGTDGRVRGSDMSIDETASQFQTIDLGPVERPQTGASRTVDGNQFQTIDLGPFERPQTVASRTEDGNEVSIQTSIAKVVSPWRWRKGLLREITAPIAESAKEAARARVAAHFPRYPAPRGDAQKRKDRLDQRRKQQSAVGNDETSRHEQPDEFWQLPLSASLDQAMCGMKAAHPDFELLSIRFRIREKRRGSRSRVDISRGHAAQHWDLGRIWGLRYQPWYRDFYNNIAMDLYFVNHDAPDAKKQVFVLKLEDPKRYEQRRYDWRHVPEPRSLTPVELESFRIREPLREVLDFMVLYASGQERVLIWLREAFYIYPLSEHTWSGNRGPLDFRGEIAKLNNEAEVSYRFESGTYGPRYIKKTSLSELKGLMDAGY